MEDTASLTIEVEVQRLHWNIDPVHGKYSKCTTKGMGNLKLPSLNLLPQFQEVIVPSFIFCIRTTELRIPGTAEEARRALQMTQSGAVI